MNLKHRKLWMTSRRERKFSCAAYAKAHPSPVSSGSETEKGKNNLYLSHLMLTALLNLTIHSPAKSIGLSFKFDANVKNVYKLIVLTAITLLYKSKNEVFLR